jgi:ribosomal protein S18 acetylase RimI-like enzyme
VLMWKTRKLTDKSQILAYLETDRRYAAYAIGDLEPWMFEHTSWAGAERAGRLQALTLHFRGLKLPALFLMGHNEGLRAIIERELRPERVYFTCHQRHLLLICEFYHWEERIPMWRMVLQPARFRPAQSGCVRLSHAHLDELTQLYALGGGDAFTLLQLEHGVFYGVRMADQLVAVAGTHLVSPTYGVAAVGNVFTHPNYRGRGFGTATTSAVVDELLQSGIRDIVLNVSQDNAIAVRLYERLGFERYCPFLEGPAFASRTTNRQPIPATA